MNFLTTLDNLKRQPVGRAALVLIDAGHDVPMVNSLSLNNPDVVRTLAADCITGGLNFEDLAHALRLNHKRAALKLALAGL